MKFAFKTNLRCESCLSVVGPIFDNEPLVKEWEADLADPKKLLRVELDSFDDTERVIEIMGEAGYEASLTEPTNNKKIHENDNPTLSTYKPLLIVICYILGATVLAEFIHGSFEWQRAMSYFMGFFFLGFAFFKLLDVTGFANAFSTYDVIAKRSPLYSLLYPWLELGLGILFVSRAAPQVANVLTAIVMSVGLVGVVAAIRKKQVIQCACLGTVFNLPMTMVTVVENSLMIVMAAIMLVANQFS